MWDGFDAGGWSTWGRCLRSVSREVDVPASSSNNTILSRLEQLTNDDVDEQGHRDNHTTDWWHGHRPVALVSITVTHGGWTICHSVGVTARWFGRNTRACHLMFVWTRTYTGSSAMLTDQRSSYAIYCSCSPFTTSNGPLSRRADIPKDRVMVRVRADSGP